MLILILLGSLACRLGQPSQPEVTILTPANDQTLILHQEVVVQSVSVSPDGVSRVELWVNGELVDTQAGGQPQSLTALHRWTPTVEGTYLLEIRAFDNNNLRSDPVAVRVSVGYSDNPASDPLEPTSTTASLPAITTKTDLNIRTGPSVDYPAIGYLRQGQSAQIIGVNQTKTWWKILHSHSADGIGWVSAHERYSTATQADRVPIVSTPILPTTVTPQPSATPTSRPTQINLPVIHYFRASQTNITAGETVLLMWDLDGAKAAYLYPEGEKGVVAPGDLQVTPRQTTTYRLVALNEYGEVEAIVTITVE